MRQVNRNSVDFKKINTLRNILHSANSSDVQHIINQLVVIKVEKSQEEDEQSLNFMAMGRTNNAPLLVAGDLRHEDYQSPLDLKDLMAALANHFSSETRGYHAARIKYRFVDLDGNKCEWSGQGRLPLKFRDLLEATGRSRDEFLVSEATDEKSLLKLATKYYSPDSKERLPLTESQQRLENFSKQIEKEQQALEMALAAQFGDMTPSDDTFDDQFCKY